MRGDEEEDEGSEEETAEDEDGGDGEEKEQDEDQGSEGDCSSEEEARPLGRLGWKEATPTVAEEHFEELEREQMMINAIFGDIKRELERNPVAPILAIDTRPSEEQKAIVEALGFEPIVRPHAHFIKTQELCTHVPVLQTANAINQLAVAEALHEVRKRALFKRIKTELARSPLSHEVSIGWIPLPATDTERQHIERVKALIKEMGYHSDIVPDSSLEGYGDFNVYVID